VDKQAFEDEAERLLKAADAGGITLRVLGALAFARRCPRHAYLQETLGRAYTDIDFAGYGRQVGGIRSLLGKEGYVEDEMTYVESEGSRMVLTHPRTGLHLDVFLDRLSFCHTVRWDARMQAERDTIPLAEMLLQKMQIVQINEKDIIDNDHASARAPPRRRRRRRHQHRAGRRHSAPRTGGGGRTLTMNLGRCGRWPRLPRI
jgi:hypothetical protein